MFARGVLIFSFSVSAADSPAALFHAKLLYLLSHCRFDLFDLL
jgi:hypothetical protein